MSKALGSLTVGAKIEVPVLSAYQSRFGSKIVFKIADKNHSGYPSNSVTLITEKIIQNVLRRKGSKQQQQRSETIRQ